MKMHLGRGDESRKTLCGMPAGFDMPGIPVELESEDVCRKCARIARVSEPTDSEEARRG